MKLLGASLWLLGLFGGKLEVGFGLDLGDMIASVRMLGLDLGDMIASVGMLGSGWTGEAFEDADLGEQLLWLLSYTEDICMSSSVCPSKRFKVSLLSILAVNWMSLFPVSYSFCCIPCMFSSCLNTNLNKVL